MQDLKKKHLVNYGDTCTYSMHPLKNLNVWGDGGFIVTNNKSLADKLFLIRNHGLKNRNNVEVFGYNSRLDTIQAVVANYKMRNKLDNITSKRISNSIMLDKLLAKNKKAKVSCHYLITKEGKIIQMVPENKTAWHAGFSRWKSYRNLNTVLLTVSKHSSVAFELTVLKKKSIIVQIIETIFFGINKLYI